MTIKTLSVILAMMVLPFTIGADSNVRLYGNYGTSGEWYEVGSSSCTFDLYWEMDFDVPERSFDLEIFSGDTNLMNAFYKQPYEYSYFAKPDHSVFTVYNINLDAGDYSYRIKLHDETDWYGSTIKCIIDKEAPTVQLTSPSNNAVFTQGTTVRFTFDVTDDTVLDLAIVDMDGEYHETIGLGTDEFNKVWPSEGQTHTHTWDYTLPSKGKAAPIDFAFEVTDAVGHKATTIPSVTIDVVKKGLGGPVGPDTCSAGGPGDPCETNEQCCSGKCKGKGECM